MTSSRITVLGLGRMGTAMARRLDSLGFDVTGWTRSGRVVDGVDSAPDPATAVADAEVVVLALFDGAACREVAGEIRSSIRPDALVVNTSTIGPDEAAGLAGELGANYVHAPVLGSVPAMEAGALTVVAAGPRAEQARPVLEAFGEVVLAPDASTSAALKLVANASLAGALLALRDCLQQAAGLDLSRDAALDGLAKGQLGALVERKRGFLTGAGGDAEFTVDALAKDMELLSAASGVPLPAVAQLAASPAGQDADIALVATAPAVDEAVLAPLHAYVRGHATGDAANFRDAFLPGAHVEGIRDGAFVSWTLDDYCTLFSGVPAPDEAARSRRIDSVDVHKTVATASMTLHHGSDTFTDVFLLVLVDGAWKIANKAYHRH